MKIYRAGVSRRSLLKALGSAAAIPGIANLLTASITEAAPAAAPLRFIAMWMGYHISEGYWIPRLSNGGGPAPGGTAAADFDITYNHASLSPLDAYKSRMLILRGLNYEDALQHALGGHDSGGTFLTGAACSYVQNVGPSTTATSLDHRFHGRLGAPGARTPFVVGLETYGHDDDPFTYVGGTGGERHANGDPMELYNTFFSGFTPPADAGTADLAQTNRRVAMANFSMGELNGLRSRLATPERQKLDQHLSVLTDFRTRLLNTPTVTCAPPAQSSVQADPGSNSLNPPDYSLMPSSSSSFSQLISQIFACDLTRFGAYKMGHSSGQIRDAQGRSMATYVDPSNAYGYRDVVDFHDTITHHAPLDDLNDPRTVTLSLWHRYWYQHIRVLLDALSGTPDPYAPGQTLLDNTVVLVGIQGGFTGHGYADVPFLLFGGERGTGFNMGRLLDYRAQNMGNGVPHNALLAALFNAFERNQAVYKPGFQPQIVNQLGDYPAAPLVLT